MSKKEMIGLDRTYKQVHVGDTIQDAEGVKYTITERGTAVGPGGKEVQYHTIKGPELCSDEQKQEAPAAPVKKEEKIFPKRRGGKENKSGLVSLSNLARKLHTKQVGFARTLRAGGIDVVKCKSGYSIHVEDVEKAEQLLAPLKGALQLEKKPAKSPLPKNTIRIPLAPIIEACRQEDEHAGPAVDFDGIREAEKAVAGLGSFDDQQLADELRRRGYEVTATKTVTVSL